MHFTHKQKHIHIVNDNMQWYHLLLIHHFITMLDQATNMLYNLETLSLCVFCLVRCCNGSQASFHQHRARLAYPLASSNEYTHILIAICVCIVQKWEITTNMSKEICSSHSQFQWRCYLSSRNSSPLKTTHSLPNLCSFTTTTTVHSSGRHNHDAMR